MVFESVVSTILNKVLGDFVENLDASQLNVGIWGGDVKLDNLEVKQTALDDLDLPIKIRFGYLSSLVLKIPWKNLYTEPVIANIDGLHLIVVPNKGVVYNEEKARKNSDEIKQKTLARLEEARKNRRKPADPVSDSFTEKMITQIIKNLQISITNIHVRFEDKWTNRHRPFAAGITLEKLNFLTTDSNFKATIHKEAVKIIYKLVNLDNLAVYWNSDVQLFSDLADRKEIKTRMLSTIASGSRIPENYKYVLEPIKMSTKLQLNQKPETDGSNFKIPKIDLFVDLQQILLKIGKLQYQDILLFLEAQERFTLAGQYLKYRPVNISEYKGHYKQWWKFAYTSILEEKVRRRRRNWSWQRMKDHRHLVREYRDAWVKHQTEKSPAASVTSTIERAEKKLDVFNINIARQQAEMEIDRKKLTRVEDQPQGIMGWAKSWWGGSSTTSEDTKKHGTDIVSQFEEAMTPEEKAKLFEAIDYQENIPPTNYPKEYIENKITARLAELAIIVEDAVSLHMLSINTLIQQRPSASAMNLQLNVQELKMDGCGAEMLRVRDTSKRWLELELDTNPSHGQYDQKVKLAIAPITLKYHAPAVNAAADVFKPPESVRLNQLTAAAMSRFEEVKARSATGLAHAVEIKKKLILDIAVNPATLMVSEGGVYTPDKPTIVADLGLLTIKTVDPKSEDDLAGLDRMAKLREQAYDRFRVKLSNVVIAFAENLASAFAAVDESESPLHILKPTGLDIQLHKCGVEDLSLPRMRVVGDLPDIVIAISDKRLLMLLQLLNSIPTPKAEETPEIIEDFEVSRKNRAKIHAIMEVDETETAEEAAEKAAAKAAAGEEKKNEQQVQIELDLKLETIGVIVFKGEHVLTDVRLQRFKCQMQMRTFDLIFRAELGSISVGMPMFKALDDPNEFLRLINSFEDEGALMKLKFVQANPESPFFATDYKKTEMAVDFKFSRLNVSLHQQAFLAIKEFGEELQAAMAAQKSPHDDEADGDDEVKLKLRKTESATRKISRKLSASIDSIAQAAKDAKDLQQAAAKKKKNKKRKPDDSDEEPDPTIIKMSIDASIGQLAVLLGTDDNLDTFMAIEQIKSEVKMTLKKMDVLATLQSIKILDMTKDALHKNLMAVAGDSEMLKFEMTQFQRTSEEKLAMTPTDIDMKVKLRLAQMRFVFLQLWVNRMQAFAAPFGAETAKAKAHAQAVAAEKSQEALVAAKNMLEQSPPRIELDIVLLAPIIFVPRLSTSTHVLVIDLGNLTVRNKITGHRQYQKAVIDNMKIALSNVYFGIGRMDAQAQNLESKCEILQPINFELDVHRNLTFGTVKEIAETAVDAHLPSITMAMAHDDYATMMHTLSGNMSEGKELVDAGAPVATVVVEKKEDNTVTSSDEKPTQKISTAVATAYKKLLFKFVLDHIALELFTGASVRGSRDSANRLASLRLEGLKLSGSIKENNELEVALSLEIFKMIDEREGKTMIPRLMDKKDGSENERFLDLTFSQTADQNKNVKVKMSEFFLCVCPEFLGCLASFFTVPKTQEEVDREATLNAIKGAPQQQAIASGGKTTSTTQASSSSGDVAQQQGTILMDCEIKGVEVIIIEDSMHPDSTQALIMSFNVRLKGQPNESEQTMHGGIEKLRIFSSYYAPEKRKEVTYEVLKAVDIGIAAKINNESKDTNVFLKMTPLELKMAPSVIRLLAAANAEFARANQAETESIIANPKRPAHPNYWAKRKVEQFKMWYLNQPVELGHEADGYLSEEEEEEGEGSGKFRAPSGPVEKCTVEIPRVSFTLEAGNDEIPLPLIFMDMKVSADARNWSSALHVESDLSLQMSYYNESFSVWEPVIEPNEIDGQYQRWNIGLNVKGRNKLDPRDSAPAMAVSVHADQLLNLTVTKSFLQLLTTLGEVFAAAAKQSSPPVSRQLPGLSPFLIYNDTGMTIKVANTDSLKVSDDAKLIDATHGAFVDLSALSMPDKEKRENVESFLAINQQELKAELRLELLDTVREVMVGRAEKRMLGLPKHADSGKNWKLLVDVSIENGRRLITLRSHVQVTNHLTVDMEVYSKRDNNLDLAAVVPVGETVNLPVPLLFTPSGELFFKPVLDNTEVSFEALSWHDFNHLMRAPIRCNLSDDSKKGFYFEAVLEGETVPFATIGTDPQQKVINSKERRAADEIFNISLYPPLIFHNNLPFSIHFEAPLETELVAGADTIVNITPGQRLKLETTYLNEKYILDFKLDEKHEDLQVVALNTESGSNELLLGLHWSSEYGAQHCYLYAPFWLVNNTAMTLSHMESSGGLVAATTKCVPCRHKNIHEDQGFSLRHPPELNPIILPFPSTNLAQKKKSRVQILNESEWSDEFPLDTVGNTARVTCKGIAKDFDLSVSIQLCQSGLTKIVSFAPFYLVSNCGRFDLEVRENGQKDWLRIPAEACLGLYPSQREKRKMLTARYAGSTEESLLFPITENIETFAQLNDDTVGFNVASTVGESSVTIHITPFGHGSAPAFLVNTLKVPVLYGQKGEAKETLDPKEQVYFTWSNLTTPRILELEVGIYKGEIMLEQNAMGDMKIRDGARSYVYFASFIDRRQRTVLFTDDQDVCAAAYNGTWNKDDVNMEMELTLKGLGISVVDNIKGREVLYMGISSSDILWEESTKRGHFKPLAVKYMVALEEGYQEWLKTKEPVTVQLDKYEADIGNLILRKKKNGKEVKLRRSFENGVWARTKFTKQKTNYHFKLNHLQIDNQLDACVFPCVLSVVPPPKSVIQDNAPKPFIEFSMVERTSEYSAIPEIEYCKLLVQEFAVRVDQGLINAALALAPVNNAKKAYDKEIFDEDLKLTTVNLSDVADAWKSQKPKSYYGQLHISPLMIHLSFSQGGNTVEDRTATVPIQSEFINVLLKSVGVTVTELQDVVFKLAYFERNAVLYNQEQLNSEVIRHYSMQFIKQLYVLVLGLDIIGNPFGLVRDLSTGVEDLFYQPFQGLIQGPEEFATGVAIGVQSMFGHAVGGAAGAVGRITGTVGKGVAALTFDQEYQRKRQEDLNRRPQTFAEGMARGFKGLGMGIVDGVKGVVTKPFDGAKEDGFGGFIKGTGKGLVGLAARPISGGVDFASSVMDAVKNVSGTHREAGPIRPPRFIKNDNIVRPFCDSMARGYKIFKDTDQGALAETDEFLCYAPIAVRDAFIVTNRQLVIVRRTDMMGTWTVDWSSEYTKIREPQLLPEGLKILLVEKKRGFLGIGSSEGKIITFANANVRKGFEIIQQTVVDTWQAANGK